MHITGMRVLKDIHALDSFFYLQLNKKKNKPSLRNFFM